MSTEEAIIKAFLNLLDQYSFKNIKVDMIAEEANVSRATFYRYFPSKQDLLYALFASLSKSAATNETSLDFHKSLLNYYQSLEENRERINKIIRQSPNNELFNNLFRYTLDYFSEAFKVMNKLDKTSKNELVYVCSGLAGLTMSIVDSTRPIDVEQAAKDNYNFIPDHFHEVADPLMRWLAEHHIDINGEPK